MTTAIPMAVAGGPLGGLIDSTLPGQAPTDASVCVFAYSGRTWSRMKSSMNDSERPDAAESAYTSRRGPNGPSSSVPSPITERRTRSISGMAEGAAAHSRSRTRGARGSEARAALEVSNARAASTAKSCLMTNSVSQRAPQNHGRSPWTAPPWCDFRVPPDGRARYG